MEIPFEIELSPRFILNPQTKRIRENGSNPPRDWRVDDPNVPAIEIFRDRMDSWFFEPAVRLIKEGDHIAAVHIVTPLIEALECRYRGQSSRDHSREFFKAQAKTAFGIDEGSANILYGGVRCGFAHQGFVKGDDGPYNILITSGRQAAIEYQGRRLWIDAPKYVETIRKAFTDYYNLATHDPEFKRKFLRLWNDDWEMSLRATDQFGTVRGT